MNFHYINPLRCLRKPQLYFLILAQLSFGLVLAQEPLTQLIPEPRLTQSMTAALEDIYRIELVVFTNNTSYSDEQWPARPTLNYPEKLLFLNDKPAHEQNEAAQETETTIIIEHADETFANNALEIEIAAAKTPNNLTSLPALLQKLPVEKRALNQSAAAINRRNTYSVLFHEAWLQRLESPDNAGALVINGGANFGSHKVLEGSVTFSKKRFLHINTNLWLNEFDTVKHQTRHDEWQHYYADSILLPDLPKPLPGLSEEPNHADIENDNALTTSFSDNTKTSKALSAVNQQFGKTNGFSVKRAYQLKEYRRLKRDEIHYLDHPRFGLIVTISKYTVETKAED